MPNLPQRLSPHSPTGAAPGDPTAIQEKFGLLPNLPRRLLLSSLRRDPALQPRAEMVEEVAQEYAEAMKAGAKFPPGVVFDDGEVLWLVDGWHRVRAVEINQWTEFEFEVRPGSRREALEYSLGVNDKHGLRRTNEDKRRAVQTALADPKWSEMSSREIAKLCAVSYTFVENCRRSVTTVVTERKSREKKTESRQTVDGRTIKVRKQAPKAVKKTGPQPVPKPTFQELPEYIVDHLTLAAQGLNRYGFPDHAESVYGFIDLLDQEFARQKEGEE